MRMMPTMRTPVSNAILLIPVLVVASAAASGCDIAMANFKEKETSEWRKTYDLQPGGRI